MHYKILLEVAVPLTQQLDRKVHLLQEPEGYSLLYDNIKIIIDTYMEYNLHLPELGPLDKPPCLPGNKSTVGGGKDAGSFVSAFSSPGNTHRPVAES